MKIGDMVKQKFTDQIERYGIIVEDVSELSKKLGFTKLYVKVKYLPHPELPINNGDMYWEYTEISNLIVVSSVC